MAAADDAEASEDDLHRVLRGLFGFSTFRPRQESTIRRVLAGQSSLLVLGTGSGKSLCYQLPAFICVRDRNAFTLVVSPLISLMIDQHHNLPRALPGAIIHGQMDLAACDKVFERVAQGKLHVLFVSPEKLASGAFQHRLKVLARPLAFVCVDEVHCASEWSHNFRPSYLRLGDVLRTIFGAPCILGLSATLTAAAEKDVARIFGFTESERGSLVRSNVLLRVERLAPGQDKIAWLVGKLKTVFGPTDSVIIYCTRQNQADEVAMALRTRMFEASSYHAGKSAAERELVQSQFVRNELPIVVATVAFGLGLDKPDVRGVIHLSLPKSIENYVQETGRSGRDGATARCMALVDKSDYERLRSLCFSCSVHRRSLESLLNMLLPPAEAADTTLPVLRAIRIDHAAVTLDMRRETLETLLNHLEQHSGGAVEAAHATNINATVTLTAGDKDALAAAEPLVQRLLKYAHTLPARKRSSSPRTAVQVSLMDLVGPGETLRDVTQQLWVLQKEHKLRFDLSDLAIPVLVHPARFRRDELLHSLVALVAKLEATSTSKVDQVHAMLLEAAALPSAFDTTAQQYLLETEIASYFASTEVMTATVPPPQELSKSRAVTMMADVRVFVRRHRDQLDTSLSVARILHGLSSPRYPSIDWFRNAFWSRYVDVPLETLRDLAARAMGERAMGEVPAAAAAPSTPAKRPIESDDHGSASDASSAASPAKAASPSTSPPRKRLTDGPGSGGVDVFDFAL